MPEAKMRSMGPANLAFWAAEANSSFRLVPDQNSRSKSSLRARMRFEREVLAKDRGPAGNRDDHEQQHDHLHHETGVEQEVDDGEVLVHGLKG
jgi:hypothetical protein